MQILLFNALVQINMASLTVKKISAPIPNLSSSNWRMESQGALQFTSSERITKRQRRRLRAPPSSLKQWITTLSDRVGKLQIWIDLDNSADSLEQLEASKTVHGLNPGNSIEESTLTFCSCFMCRPNLKDLQSAVLPGQTIVGHHLIGCPLCAVMFVRKTGLIFC